MSEVKKVEPTPVNVAPEPFWKSFLRRALSAITMISAFCLIVYDGHFYVTLFVLVVQCSMYFEIMALSHRRDQEENLPGFRFMSVLFLLVVLFIGYGKTLNVQLLSWVSHIKDQKIHETLHWILEKHTFLS